MIEGLGHYPVTSAIDDVAIPSLPVHWKFLRNGSIFSEVAETGHPELELLSIKAGVGILRQSSTGRKVRASEDRSQYKRIEPGWLGYNVMNAFFGGIGISSLEGILSPAYAVARPKFELCGKFYQYLFQTPTYLALFNREAYGIMYERNRLYFDRFRQIPAPVPPLDEQRLIVRFLDWHGVMTGKIIRAKRRLIALLNDQKQSIIHRAVTRGLDPAAKLKPSGVEWLGDVPEHWEVKPLKWLSDINRETLGKNTPEDFAFNYVDIRSVGTGMLAASPERMTFKASPSRARRVVRLGDTIISTVRTYLKAIWYVDQDRSDLIASTGFAVLTPHEQVSSRFFAFALQSAAFINLVISRSDGVAYPAINETRLGSLKLTLPPTLGEQDEIIAHLDEATVAYDQAIRLAQDEITLIEEFRTRLITDVVTGQLDVRVVAANLPELTEGVVEADVIDEDDLDADDNDLIDAEEAA